MDARAGDTASPARVAYDDGVVYVGDCRVVLPTLPPDSVDAVVCDPPYDLTAGKKGGTGLASVNLASPAGRARITAGFMGKAWDGTGVAFDPETWRAVYRVLKPGGHLVAFGGTRTSHRMVCAIEDAGFEIRDTLAWLYGSGFPKSLNVSRAIDKAAGVDLDDVLAPATDDARTWQGWGTALKPAHEPIVLARKPLSECNHAANVLRWGTGALNVDGCRIEGGGNRTFEKRFPGNRRRDEYRTGSASGSVPTDIGRFPANVVLDEVAADLLDAQSGERSSGKMLPGQQRKATIGGGGYHGNFPDEATATGTYGDTGGASRFFYTAKATKTERLGGNRGRGPNEHPTVKPVALMRWLCALVTPPGGLILDPFLGSGTTAIAAIDTGFRWVGIEQSAEYATVAIQRIGLGAHLVEFTA